MWQEAAALLAGLTADGTGDGVTLEALEEAAELLELALALAAQGIGTDEAESVSVGSAKVMEVREMFLEKVTACATHLLNTVRCPPRVLAISALSLVASNVLETSYLT